MPSLQYLITYNKAIMMGILTFLIYVYMELSMVFKRTLHIDFSY